jgi:glycosyltransferase involved in cell wall biosynthesis
MRIATTGFVSSDAGSVASANAVFVKELLRLGERIDFFTKPSFVDASTAVAGCLNEDRLEQIDCTNHYGDTLRKLLSKSFSRTLATVGNRFDSFTYNRGLVAAMREARGSDIDLWLGDWARGRGSRPVVSYVQGPPGTDAVSVFRHRALIERLAGRVHYFKLCAYAQWRLSFGLPNLDLSDHFILGSVWSVNDMANKYGIDPSRLHAIPYPIDLEFFKPSGEPRSPQQPLRLLWLGRFVPRKRLELFLAGLAMAIGEGCDVEAWVIGKSGFVPHYERLIEEFSYQDRIRHRSFIPRMEVPGLMAEVDVLAQPSDDENFGSSVAEALACGVPAIVGKTNGTGDYLCDRSVRLNDDRPETLARIIVEYAKRKRLSELQDRHPSRVVAERNFAPTVLAKRLREVLCLARNS